MTLIFKYSWDVSSQLNPITYPNSSSHLVCIINGDRTYNLFDMHHMQKIRRPNPCNNTKNLLFNKLVSEFIKKENKSH